MNDKIKEVMGLVETLANSSVRWGHASAFVDVEECDKHRNASLEIHKAIESKLRELLPEGVVLVPVEPTDAMIEAADESDRVYSQRAFGGSMHLCQSGEDHWHVMVASAPKETK